MNTYPFKNTEYLLSSCAIISLLVALASTMSLSLQSSFFTFIFLNFFLFSSSAFVVLRETRESKNLRIFHPISIFFIFNIFLGLSLPNLRYLYSSPFEFLPYDYIFLDADLYATLNFSLFLHMIGFLSFYTAYKFIFSDKLTNLFKGFVNQWLYLRREALIDSYLILTILIIIYLFALMFLASIGAYSYGSDLDSDNYMLYKPYLDIAISAIYLFFICLGYNLFSKKAFSSKGAPAILLIIFTMIGFASGSKFQAMLPILCFGIGYYLGSKKIIFGKAFITFSILCLAVIFLAYLVIEPYRQIRVADVDIDFKGAVIELTDTFFEEAPEEIGIDETSNFEEIPNAILGRFDMFSASTNTVFFIKERGFPDYESVYRTPDFQLGILLAPIYALVPRLLWVDKPSSQIGGWVQTNILESEAYSAAYVGSIGYAFISGGVIGIILIYGIFGVITRFFTNILYFSEHDRGKLVFIVLFIPFLRMESELGPILQGFIRDVPVTLVLMSLIFLINDKLISHR